MKPNGRRLATLAVGVAVGAGVAIPATAVAQSADRPASVQAAHSAASGGSMMGHDMGSMMSMMRGMTGEDGPTRAEMKKMARVCTQMMDQPRMQRMHDRRMNHNSDGTGRMGGRMTGDM